jgi:hypothetical protein
MNADYNNYEPLFENGDELIFFILLIIISAFLMFQ